MRGAHGEHLVHGCDAGRVEAQRLVERQRELPSRKGGRTMRGEVWTEGGRGVCDAELTYRLGGGWLAAAHERHAREEGPAVKAGGLGHARSAR